MNYAFPDRTLSGKLSITKAFLTCLDATRDPIDIYKTYFLEYTLIDPDYNLSALARFSSSESLGVIRAMYRSEEPMKNPDWLSFWSPHDVNRLCDLLNIEPVIYVVSTKRALPDVATAGWIRESASNSEIFHDFRSTTYESPENQQCVKVQKYFLIGCCGPERRLYLLNDQVGKWLDERIANVVGMPFEVARTTVASRNSDDGGCADFIDALCLVLSSSFAAGSEPRIRVATASEILFVSEDAIFDQVNERAVGGLAKPFIIVSFVRNAGRTSIRDKRNRGTCVKNCRFFTLGVISSVPASRPFSERVPDASKCDVVCVYAKTAVCLMAEEWRHQIVAHHFHTRGLKERLQNRHMTKLDGLSKKVSPGELQEALNKTEAQRKRDRSKKAHRKKCKCETCHDKTDFDSNMSKVGPERLCSTNYTISDLLKILNIDYSLDTLEKIVELSIAAMDIESRTESIDLIGPNPGPGIEYAQVDLAVLEGHVKKVQTPIMIAHTDAETINSTWSLTSRGDDASDTFDLMRRYWAGVEERRRICVAKKKELAKPVFELLDEYRSAFTRCYMNHVQDSRTCAIEEYHECQAELEATHDGTDAELDLLKDSLLRKHKDLLQALPEARRCIKAWKATLPGQLETKLLDLVTSYTVFSFCG